MDIFMFNPALAFKSSWRRTLLLLLLIISLAPARAQNKYGLKVIDDLESYQASVKQNSANRLVNLAEHIPDLKLDIRYATANNFMHEPVYRLAKAFARLPVAEALKNIQAELAKRGLGLKIYDGYRPYSVTVYFYDKLQDSVFLAVPWRGSRHNRGTAVDLTLVDLKTGKELKMPTPYDAISAKSDINYAKLSKKVLHNRELLKNIMHQHGFEVYAPEWWHYDFEDYAGFDLLDIPFEELLKAN